jgi:hypothetical protein
MLNTKQANINNFYLNTYRVVYLIITLLTLSSFGNSTVCFPTPVPYLFGGTGGDTKINTF